MSCQFDFQSKHRNWIDNSLPYELHCIIKATYVSQPLKSIVCRSLDLRYFLIKPNDEGTEFVLVVWLLFSRPLVEAARLQSISKIEFHEIFLVLAQKETSLILKLVDVNSCISPY